MKEHETTDTDAIIAATLKTVPKPRLSAGFSAAVMDGLERDDRRRRACRRASVVGSVFWALALVGSGFIIAGIRWPGWMSLFLLALTPFVFFALASRIRILPRLERPGLSKPT
jgi:hypothetical protein